MDIHIDRITLREIQLTLKEPFQISSGTTTTRRILLLEVEDKEGVTVWSECVAGEKPNYFPETIDTARIAITQYIAPLILHKSFRHPREIKALLDPVIRGNSMAKATIDMAAWAIMAEKQGKSLASLLGGVQTEIPVGISIGIQSSPQALADRVRRALEEGYHKIKIKIKPGFDIDYVKAVHAENLMVDANNAYTLADIDILKQLDQFNLMMIEQPLAWDDVFEHAELQKQLRTPICLDESIANVAKVREMIALGSGRIVNIKAGRVGGLTEALAIHDLCQKHTIPVWCGGMLESGIGRAYNVALASLPNFKFPGDLSPTDRYWKEDIVEPEWIFNKNGKMTVPFDEKSIGVTVKKDMVERITTHKEILA